MTTTSITRRPIRGAGLLLAALASLALPCLAQVQTEGYDPLRQITAQVTRANLLIVQDTTGSMGGDVEGNSVGTDWTGQVPTLAWSKTSSTCGSGSSSSLCKTWNYVLTLTQQWPSRIATVKNALGNSVTIITPWGFPNPWPALGAAWSGTVTGPTYTTGVTTHKWTWTVKYGSQTADPGFPFVAYAAGGVPTIGTPSVTLAPQDVIGNNANRVNWGLVAFSDNRGSCSQQDFLVPIDTTDQGDVRVIEAYMTLTTVMTPVTINLVTKNYWGLDVGGGTPTIGALKQAKDVLSKTFSGGTVSANNGNTLLTADPRAACDRTYGTILVTDGMSNSCNPSNDNWAIAPCSFCDSVGAIDCPNNYALFAAAQSEAIWGLNLTNAARTAKGMSPITPRTWVIGVSPVVGPCELNYIAYKGRTDSDAALGDAGFATTSDPRLPGGSPGTYVGPNGRGTYPLGADTTKDYAFFATSASEINDAFTKIINATATGDYATSAPLSGAGALQSNVVSLPSTEFPAWLGHFYAYDSSITKQAYVDDNKKCYKWLDSCYNKTDPNSNSSNSCIACMIWDAGYLLTEPKRAAASRKIYTWNPASGNALVEIVAANLATLQTIAPSLTAAHVDFIRGNDGTVTNTPRSWRLGPLLNTTPALIAAPLNYTQNMVSPLHVQFRIDQGTRTPVLWVGSSDGMLHGFRLADGYEQVALLPPTLLLNQKTLYDNYKNPKNSVTGQLPDTTKQVYGVANSLRFSDVYFPAVGAVPASFKTVGFLALGPGGAELTAIDLTHPSPGDAGYGFGDSSNPPVQILWRKTKGSGTNQLPGLFDSWSLPALAPVSATTYRLVVGGGFNKTNTKAAQIAGGAGFVNPVYYILNPTDGTLINTQTMTSTNSPAPFVGNQAFADSVFLSTAAKFYQEDNLADLGLQADLNGRISFASGGSAFPNSAVGIDVTGKVITNQQPIYYPPAASGYGPPGSGCDVFAFASGTLYERSATVTGLNVGTGIGSPLPFEPSLYVAAAKKPSTAGSPPSVSATQILRVKINSLVAPACTAPCDPNAGHNLHNSSQVTAAPFLLVPKSGTGVSKAFFLVYDPTDGCNGFSYIVELDVTNDTSCNPSFVTPVGAPPSAPAGSPMVYGGGVGAASGFTMSADQVKVAQSGIGSGATATISTIPNVTSTSGGTFSLVPQWWRELK